MKISYICDCCNKLHDTEEECTFCESEHVFLSASDVYKDMKFDVACKFDLAQRFPNEIAIVAKDGTILVTYRGSVKGNDPRVKISRE